MIEFELRPVKGTTFRYEDQLGGRFGAVFRPQSGFMRTLADSERSTLSRGWVRQAVMGVLRWKELPTSRAETPIGHKGTVLQVVMTFASLFISGIDRTVFISQSRRFAPSSSIDGLVVLSTYMRFRRIWQRKLADYAHCQRRMMGKIVFFNRS